MFKDIMGRYDASSASLDVIIILAVAFLLGFLFCYFRNRNQQED